MNPDPRYHVEWSQRYADRATRWATASLILAGVAFAFSVLRLVGVIG